jgi:fructooligosaccharide transport system substrate-binding protein
MRRKIMKKLISMLLVLSLGLGLAACSSKASTSTASTTTSATTNASSANEVVKLKIWVHTTDEGDEGKVYGERVAAFNAANDKIKAELEYIPRGGGGSGYEDKINTALTTGQLPDVITLDGPNTAAYADAGIIAPIDQYISTESKADYMPSIIQQGTYQGKLYGLGNMESTVPLFYNVDLLNKYNIKPGTMETPWTWDDLYTAAKTITAGEKVPALNMALDWTGEGKIYALAPFAWSNGGNIIGEDGLTAKGVFNSPEAVEAFTFIQKLVKDGVAAVKPEANSFELGKAAFSLNGPWEVATLEKQYKDLKWSAMPYPISPKTKKLQVPTGSWQFAATASSKHVAEAAKLVEWMTNTDSVVAVSNAIGMLPGRLSAIAKLPQYQDGARKLMVDQLKTAGRARPSSVIYPIISRSFEEAIDEVINGDDPQTVLDSKVAVIEREAARLK